MNVAFVLHQTNPANGAARSFLVMLKGLMQQGDGRQDSLSVSPFVILPERNGLYLELEQAGVPVFTTTYKYNTYPDTTTWKDVALFLPRLIARLYVNRRAAKVIAHYLADKHIDLVHTNVSVCGVGYEAARLLGVPHVYHIREYGDKDFHYHYFPTRQAFLRRLDAPRSYTVFITKAIQQHFHQEGKAESRVIYNGICSRQASFLDSKDSGKDYFLYVGTVIPPKGLYELLTAYRQYKAVTSSLLPLYVVGNTDDKSYFKKLQQYIADHSLNDDIKFLGVSKDVAPLMRQARAIIIPSLNEAFGRCMAEAMFNGCLCIGRNTSGTKEQLDNGVQHSGEEIALRYDTEDQLATLLSQVSSADAGDYLPMRERAFNVVNSLYSSEAHVDYMLNFYQTIVNQNTDSHE